MFIKKNSNEPFINEMRQFKQKILTKTIKRYAAASFLVFLFLLAIDCGVTMYLNGIIPDFSVLLTHALCSLMSAGLTLYVGYKLIQKRNDKTTLFGVAKTVKSETTSPTIQLGEKR